MADLSQNLKPTRILDWRHPSIHELAVEIGSINPARSFVQAAHRKLASLVKPIYDLDELQPVSVTIRKRCGSCSQRMACLEAVSRAGGICTRVRALHIAGEFWYPRFPRWTLFIPRKILLVWPQFLLDGVWVNFDELYGSIAQLATCGVPGFRNDGESLFEAVENTAVDFNGKSCGLQCASPGYDLSRFVLSDEGTFDARDEVFERFGSFQHSVRGVLFRLMFSGKASIPAAQSAS